MLSRMLGPLSVLCLGAVVLFVFFSVLGQVSPSEVLWPLIVVAALALLFMVRSLIVRHELGENGNRNMLRSVNNLRERRAMRSVQPHGPFCLGGMCDGVQIAQEMIVELESQGEEVSLFAIFDTWVLENTQYRRLWEVEYYLTRLRSFHRLPSKQRFATMTRALKRQLHRHRGAETDWHRAYWPGEDFRPPRFRAPVLLFKRPRQPYFYVRDPQMGWGTRSMGGVEVFEIDCGHFDFLRPPYVQRIGEKLQARLGQIHESVQARPAV